MSAFAIEDGVRLRRWSVSVFLALALHGAAALLLVKTVLLVNSTGIPIINIDLAPLDAVSDSVPAQSGPKAVTPNDAGAGSAPSERLMTGVPPQAPMPAPRESSREAIPPAAAGTMPAVKAPPDGAAPATPGFSAGAGEEARGIGGGGSAPFHVAPSGERSANPAEARHPAGPLMNAPLDTSISVMPSAHANKPGGMAGRGAIVLLRPSKHAGTLAHVPRPNASRASAPATVVNALGARVEDRVRAAHARAMSRGLEPRNAIGSAAGVGVSAGRAANAPEDVVRNAIGVPVHVQPGSPSAGTGESRRSAPVASAAANRAVINGRDMVHLQSRPGGIGGPAKNAIGGIDGSSFSAHRP